VEIGFSFDACLWLLGLDLDISLLLQYKNMNSKVHLSEISPTYCMMEAENQ